MIRIHTGGCPVCGSPIFVEFIKYHDGTLIFAEHWFQGRIVLGEIGSVIYSCECVVKAEPEVSDE